MRYRRIQLPGVTYFFTVVTEKRSRIFDRPDCVAMFNSAVEHVRSRHPFELEAQVVLPDHIHSIWTLPETDANYSSRWRLIKEAFTRSYLRAYAPPPRNRSREAKGEQAIWQRRFWEHLIRDERDFFDHLDYIHLNPVQHGLVAAASQWPDSTFSKWVSSGSYEPTWGSEAMPELPEWAKRHE